MTYDARESSVEAGNPVELYEFNVGSATFRYTSSGTQITAGGLTYLPENIKKGRLARSNTDREDRVQIALPTSNIFASQFLLIAPGKQVSLTIRRTHRDDPDGEVKTIFKGFIHGISFPDNGRKAVFTAFSITSARARQMPRFNYANLCGNSVFDTNCKVSEASYTHSLTVAGVNNEILTVSGAGVLGTDYFENGFVEYDGEFRLIMAQGGTGNNDLTLHVPFQTSPLGLALDFRAGCKHRLSEDCDTKFSNAINYAGFKFVPTKNPFATGLD